MVAAAVVKKLCAVMMKTQMLMKTMLMLLSHPPAWANQESGQQTMTTIKIGTIVII